MRAESQLRLTAVRGWHMQVKNPESAATTELRAAIQGRLEQLRKQLAHKPGEVPDQRGSPRQPYVCVQRIAPCISAIPDETSFREVLCQDISTSGFSFQSTTDRKSV